MDELYKTKQEVHNHAMEIVGKTLGQVEKKEGVVVSGKSGPGDAFEAWFGKPKDSLSEPDLREAGVELKATPIKELKNGQLSSKERLVLNIINYNDLVNENFDASHFLHKNKTIELAFYKYNKELPKENWTFEDVALYEMQKNPKDFDVIKNDWQRIQQYVIDGKAELLNEGMSDYLAACTKGASSKSVRAQPNSAVPAKQRAFSLKSGYMTNLLRRFVIGSEKTESIFKGEFDLKGTSMDSEILSILEKWKGKSVEKLLEQFGLSSKSKSLHYLLVSKMLGLNTPIKGSTDSSRVSEFEKANIILKTVSVDKRGKVQESMSFPTFNFKDLSKQQWNDENGDPSADWQKLLIETKFLFTVFQTVNGIDTFVGAKFFRLPDDDIEGPVREAWQDTVDKINNGVQLTAVESKTKSGYRIYNNFVSSSQNKVCHVRPHASNVDYSEDGKFSNQLPTPIRWINRPVNRQTFSDDWMTNQCFWLNSDYIQRQINELLNYRDSKLFLKK